MTITEKKTILVLGASGFIGRALVPALRARGHEVLAASRRPPRAELGWRTADLLHPESLPAALAGVHVAYYLAHSMGGGHADFRTLERHSAEAFAAAAAAANVARIVYLGGPAPSGEASEHLGSRLDVGEILRAGKVPTLELRASMVIGHGSASWRIVRDLAMRLPLMVLPRWLESRTRPVALEDAIAALVAGAEVPLPVSAWFDLPGPETLRGREILARIAALRGRRIPTLALPWLTPWLSALWLILVTGADFSLARELVLGLRGDLLPKDGRYWQLIDHTALVPFDEAARGALAREERGTSARDVLARLEEKLVALTARRTPSSPGRGS